MTSFVDIRSFDEKAEKRILHYLLNSGLEVSIASVPNVLTIMHLRPIDTHSAFGDPKFVFLVELDESVSEDERKRLKEDCGDQVMCFPKGTLGNEHLERVAEIVLEYCNKDD